MLCLCVYNLKFVVYRNEKRKFTKSHAFNVTTLTHFFFIKNSTNTTPQ